MADIQSEIARLTELRRQKQAEFDRDANQHVTRWDGALQDRLMREIADLDLQLDRLAEEKSEADFRNVPMRAAQTRKAPRTLTQSERTARAEVLKRHPELPDSILDAPATTFDLLLLNDSAKARIEALERTVATLSESAAEGLKYAGVWQRQLAYSRGTLVTFKGTLWHANADAAGIEPGDGKAWTMVVKTQR